MPKHARIASDLPRPWEKKETNGEAGARPKRRHIPDPVPTQADVHDLVGMYLHDAASHPLLTAEEEVDLAKKIEAGRAARQFLAAEDVSETDQDLLQQEICRGQEAFDTLIRSNTRLVISVAKKYQRRGLPLADLIQAGNIGLLRAAKKFDYSLGNKFSTYATWWIRQGITRAMADHGRTIRIPVHRLEQLTRILRTRQKLMHKLNREPTVEELAEAVSLPPRKVEAILRQTRTPISLEYPILDGDAVLGDVIEDDDTPSPEESAADSLMREDIQTTLEENLPPREARILRLRYGLQNGQRLSLREVGEKIGVTRERVRQIEAQALRRLRSPQIRHKLRAYLNPARI